jgi:hypothetical protein
LRALRIYYPRYSYPQRYLPAAYLNDADSASFLERLLANMEGFYTETEGWIRDAYTLFDPRSTPAETLDWLAGWLGLAMDPFWAEIQRRRLGKRENGVQRPPDRRRLLIRYARKLYERRGTPDGIRFSLHLLLDPNLERSLRQLKAAAVNPNHARHVELERYGLCSPSPTTGEEELEDLLYELVLARPSMIRIVEHFRTRQGRAIVEGDPTRSGTAATDAAAADAHCFSVLIPEELSPEEDAMVRRVVDLEKPAHTSYQVRRYWYGFRVGEARLGVDTTLDRGNRFTALVLGGHHLADVYLPPAHPWNVEERIISDRDQLGGMPPL